MNLLTIDIGNTNITISLFVESSEILVKSIPGDQAKEVGEAIEDAWQHIPFSRAAKDDVRDGVILVSSVKPSWTEMVEDIVADRLGEKIKMIPDDVAVPIPVAFADRESVGTDRLLAALAAYEVVKDTVIVADFGTAITIDIVDENGTFVGGTIMPGLELGATVLASSTAQLPKVEITKPERPFGQSTEEAINAGVYYGAISALQEIIRRQAEFIGRWPQTIVTGAGAKLVKDDCDFIDSFVDGLVSKGMVITYNKFVEEHS